MWKTRIDLTGQKFGKLTVKEFSGKYSSGDAKWLCQCECGREIFSRKSYLDKWQICCNECHRREHEDFTGQYIGNLTVVKRDEDKLNSGGHPVIQWLCTCDCGVDVITDIKIA